MIDKTVSLASKKIRCKNAKKNRASSMSSCLVRHGETAPINKETFKKALIPWEFLGTFWGGLECDLQGGMNADYPTLNISGRD